MKRIYIFDVDNTIFSGRHQQIFPQTLQLLKAIKENKDYLLGYATGRGPAKMGIFNDIKYLFDFEITVNGSLMTSKNKLIYEVRIDQADVEHVVKDSLKKGIAVGMVGYHHEAITCMNDDVEYALKGYTEQRPIIDPKYYLKHPVYQLWMFDKNQEKLLEIIKSYPKFKPFLWHYGGIDLIYPEISKAVAIKKLKVLYPAYQVIAVGDGHNDIDMLKAADIGVAMGNTGFEELKKAADYVTPRIEEDKLFDFFKQHNLI